MNIYDKPEIDRIEKVIAKNEAMDNFFKDKREVWSKNIEVLFEVLQFDIDNPSTATEIFNAQSLALTYKQRMSDEISVFLNKRTIETANLKKLRQDKFLFYAIGFGIKTNKGEKDILINGHIAQNERTLELIESYIEFLRDSSDNLKTFGYSIKNMIELMNYLK